MTTYYERYRFVAWRESPEKDGFDEKTFEPDLPDGTDYELLAHIGFGGSDSGPYDAIYVVRWPKELAEPPSMKAVSDHLEKLLEAGRTYPPAIAIAHDVKYQQGSESWSQAEAVDQFTTALHDELDNQRNRPFFLAKSITREYISYRRPGGYYWILRYDPNEEEPLWWVSSDFFVYQCSVTDFDVDVSWLSDRFGILRIPEPFN